jgi:hypothetical protein
MKRCWQQKRELLSLLLKEFSDKMSSCEPPQ